MKKNEMGSYEKVFIVGNGPSILNKRNGRFIDSHSIVVRFNHFDTSLKFQPFVGKKTNYWFLGDTRITKVRKNIDVVFFHCWTSDEKKKESKFYNFLINNYNCVKLVKSSLIEKMKRDFNADVYFSTGFIGIYYMLQNYKSVSISGFDWWDRNAYHKHYYYNKHNDRIKKEDSELIHKPSFEKECILSYGDRVNFV